MTEHLLTDVLSSSTRWFLGLSLGAGLALACALGISRNSFVLKTSTLLLNFGRAIPILALVPLIQFHLGPGELSKLLIVAIASFFPIIISIVLSVRDGEEERSRFYAGLSLSPYRLWRVATFPRVLDGFKRGVVISVGVAWISVVAAELLGIYDNAILKGGLGYRLSRFYDAGEIYSMWGYVFTFGALGFFSAALVERLAKPSETLQ